MKKFLPLILSLLLLLSFGCGSEETAPESAAEEPTPAQAAAEDAEASTVSSDAFTVTFSGAEQLTDKNGGPVLRVYYDFTNQSETSASAASALIAEAHQDGQRLTETEAGDLSEYAGNESVQLLKGASIRCVLEYGLISEGIVTVKLDDYEGHTLTADFDPSALSGAPSESVRSDAAELSLPEGLEAEADLFELYHVSLKAESIGEQGLRAFVEFTNVNDPAEAAFGSYCILLAYQNGVELASVDSSDLNTSVEQGKSIIYTIDYTLSDDSPVELHLCENRERTPMAGLIVEVK